jgi:hypothetical protein
MLPQSLKRLPRIIIAYPNQEPDWVWALIGLAKERSSYNSAHKNKIDWRFCIELGWDDHKRQETLELRGLDFDDARSVFVGKPLLLKMIGVITARSAIKQPVN